MLGRMLREQHHRVALHHRKRCTLERTRHDQSRTVFLAPAEKFKQRHAVESLFVASCDAPHPLIHRAPLLRLTVRTDGLAVIASEDPAVHRAEELRTNGSSLFDSEIRDALARIHRKRRDRAGRTCIDASRATSTGVIAIPCGRTRARCDDE